MTSQSSEPTDPDVGPAYAGSADEGLRSSVPADDPMLGDLAAVIHAEFAKLYGLYGDLLALLDAARFDEVRERWFGVVRETLEFEAAVQRVVVPEVGDAVTSLPDGTEPTALLDWLRAYDELNPDLQPDEGADDHADHRRGPRGAGAGAGSRRRGARRRPARPAR